MEEIKATKKDTKRKHDHIDSGIVKMLKSVDESLDIKEKEMTTGVLKESKKKKKKLKKTKDSKDSTLEKTEENRDEKEITDEAPEKKKKRKKRKKSHDNNNANSESNLDEEDLSQRKKKPKIEDTSTFNDVQDDAERNNYPYEVIPDDHCETPVEAYQDISPLLNLYAQSIQKTSSSVFIYDPFFCEGSMVERMNQLGFTNVYNRKEDFYHMKETKQTPNYDLLMTNPPYSLDHMDRLLNYCVNEMTKPFCLLLPNYVYMKEYYPKYSKFPFIYITPKNGKRYLYTTPKGRRQQKSAKITSPFLTFWYCGRFTSSMINEFRKVSSGTVSISFKATDIPLEIAPDNDPRKKKLRNNMKRKKNKQRQKQKAD